MKYAWKAALLATALLLAVAGAAGADPEDIHMTSLPDWEYAWLEQDILPVLDWNEGLEGLYPGEEDSFRPPQLYLMDELVTPEGDVDSHPGLVMAWGAPEDTGQITSAWELALPEDPDFTGMCVTLTAWPRSGMTSISFSLEDAAGTMKGWSWAVGPGGLPPDTATTITVAASGGPGQAGANGYWDGGIDLTQVVSLQFDESGIAQGGIPLPNGLPGFVGQWNYWHDIIVFPCPPARTEHFACYMVDEKTRLQPQRLSLVDQFTSEEDVPLHKAREICAPVDKNSEGVLDPDTHLVCYDLFPRERADSLIEVENQLGSQRLRVKAKMQRICVPSSKRVLR